MPDWHSIRVYYYADNKDPLIRYGVRDLFDRLPRYVESAYFLRHWRQGPHLRLNLRCADDVLTGAVRPIVDETVGRFLRERPSTTVLDPERLLPMHRRLADLEAEPGPLLPWYPDNSIHYTSGEQRRPTFEGESADELLTGFYVDTNELTFQLTEEIEAGRQRCETAFDLMISTAHALSTVGLLRGGISFRSHAEAFLNGYPEGRGLRERWDGHYARNAAALVDRVRAVVSTLDGSGGSVRHVEAWVAALTPYRQKANELLAAGRLSLDSRGADATPEITSDVTSDVTALGRASPFHGALFASPAWADLQHAPWFVSYRFMLNLTYLHFTRLGISPAERFLLCHLAANAVEDCYGTSALELIRGLGDGTPVNAGGGPA